MLSKAIQTPYKIMLIIGLFSYVSLHYGALAATHGVAATAKSKAAAQSSNTAAPEATQSKLKTVEHSRQEMHERAAAARKREALALLQLKQIKSRLAATTTVLTIHQHKLKRTEQKIKQTETTLQAAQGQQDQLTGNAAKRLREMYEGRRLTLLEMMLQVQSLQDLMDLFYFQERVAEMDRQVLDQLQTQAKVLYERRQKLGQQKNVLGDLISEVARKAMAIKGEQQTQEQVAEKLKSQRAFYEQAEKQLSIESHELEHQIVDMESASKRNVKNMEKGSGVLAYPMRAPVTSLFGWRRHPIFGVRKFHSGLDLGGPNHGGVLAADSGNVLYTGYYGGYGKVVIVSHGKGMATLYAHLSGTAVNTGSNVSKGQLIGYEGSTGFSTGPHLHFEVRINGKPNNPLQFLP
jgi:murein DD-endopeptidase MepM/ murein hydrolase activator NlpD